MEIDANPLGEQWESITAAKSAFSSTKVIKKIIEVYFRSICFFSKFSFTWLSWPLITCIKRRPSMIGR